MAATDVPEGLRYTHDHEWLKADGDEGTVGITAYAADQLGDIVYVELPKVGASLEARQAFGVIESVKTASDMYSPLAGEVVAVNDALSAKPELINEDPYGEGWIVRLRLADPSTSGDLLDPSGYRSLIEAAGS
jgi:glycine cleavage system H protein